MKQRLIDAEELMYKLFNEWNKHPDRDIRDTTGITIATMPTVDPVKHAHWIFRNKYYRYWCSVCGQPMDYEYNYCPNCGCKMDGVTE